MAEQFEQIARQMTPEIYQNMRRAIELGRWPDGRTVTAQQRETCIQAVIAWEAMHLPEEQRSGYMPPAECSSHSAGQEQPVTLRDAGRTDDA